jgi:hypothetical protein
LAREGVTHDFLDVILPDGADQAGPLGGGLEFVDCVVQRQ